MQFETFYCTKIFAKASTGKPKEWQVSVVDNGDETCTLIRTHGYIGQKIQKLKKVIRKGKNIGRSNETTYWTQAIADAKSLHQRQVDRGYVTNLADWVVPEFPMLANKFTERKKHLNWPIYGQKKLDGVRCFAKRVSETEMTYMSRSGKFYHTLDHLTPLFLESIEVGDIVDGEVYIHGETFQEIIRRVKKLRPESITLQFNSYDFLPVNDREMDQMTRLATLESIFGKTGEEKYPEILVTGTVILESEKQLQEYHDKYVMEGFEGIMLRNFHGKYLFSDGKGPRSNDLQKYKEFIDDEFEIVGAVEADEGMHKGCVKFICDARNGETFTSYPKGTLEERRQMFIDREKYIGKELTVRYQATSENGTPTFNVGIAVRDYE